MGHRSLTLALIFLFLSLHSQFISSAIHPPTPAPSPTHAPPKHIISEPAGLAMHSPPISRSHQKQTPTPVLRYPHRSPPPPPPGKLNLGKKLGLLFAAIAAVLQVTFVAFLIYKRWQLKKMGRSYRRRVSS